MVGNRDGKIEVELKEIKRILGIINQVYREAPTSTSPLIDERVKESVESIKGVRDRIGKLIALSGKIDELILEEL